MGAALISVVAFVVAGLFTIVYPWRLARRGREIGNCADMQHYAVELEDYRNAHGRYPASLAEAIPKSGPWAGLADRYGTPIRYETNGREFVLVSYGSNGRPETTNYWPYRLQMDRRPSWDKELDQCAAGADIVFTDRGCYRCCGN